MHMQNFRRRPDLDWFCLASIGPRLGPLAFTVTARLRCFLALLLRRATRSSLEHGRSRRGHVRDIDKKVCVKSSSHRIKAIVLMCVLKSC